MAQQEKKTTTAVPVTINIELTYNPVIPLPGTVSKKLRTDVKKKKTYT